jgi:hypothetical protein
LSDIEEVLNRLHLDIDHTTDGELWALCPGHVKVMGEEQGHATWSINEESGMHSCFSCGYSGNLVMLVADVLDMTTEWGTPAYERAKRWLERMVEVDLSSLRERSETLESYVALPQVLPITESRLAVFDLKIPREQCTARDLQPSQLRLLGVRWDEKNGAWILPIRDPDTNALRGWQVKAKEWVRNHPTGVKKGRTVFGIDVVEGDTVVVVESPLDVARLRALGFEAIALFGAKWTEEQFNILRRFRVVILALDNDVSGYTATYGKGKKPGLRNRLAEAGVIVKCVQWSYFENKGKDLGEFEDDADIYAAIKGALTPQKESMTRVLERLA